VPIRRGAYVRRTVWDAMTPVQRHFAKINAVVQSLEAPAVVSHQSAVGVHGLPTWDLDLSLVHVTRGDLHSPGSRRAFTTTPARSSMRTSLTSAALR
jgi:hypothetical protein